MTAEDRLEIEGALRALKAGRGELGDVLRVGRAGADGQKWVPQALIDAIGVKYTVEGDLGHGGADQVVWNDGVAAARLYARDLREVGAVENADLYDRLAAALETFEAEGLKGTNARDAVQSFLAYRHIVEGPAFAVPELAEELAKALVEYATAHAAGWPDSIDRP